MGLNILDRIQAKIELFRLEQRYTRRRHRRSTFVSNAIYVDGEYIYNSPNTTGSSSNTSRMPPVEEMATPSPQSPASPTSPTSPTESPQVSKAQKRLNRWSSMPGFGMSRPAETDPEPQPDWRTNHRMSYNGETR
ncbi:hypothetical protein B0T25DRAFT_265890 [Lasiosphaeria hispida]|uniref:Uncharacterized protein n=1 Tax=Lasiosphaeria hispida TaxID=260671 RepID=A0AAJ0MAK4_9PEZI|nr:hypothetical protein B0T25DRAFT_265890 [Lasiosphaeria hispida]